MPVTAQEFLQRIICWRLAFLAYPSRWPGKRGVFPPATLMSIASSLSVASRRRTAGPCWPRMPPGVMQDTHDQRADCRSLQPVYESHAVNVLRLPVCSACCCALLRSWRCIVMSLNLVSTLSSEGIGWAAFRGMSHATGHAKSARIGAAQVFRGWCAWLSGSACLDNLRGDVVVEVANCLRESNIMALQIAQDNEQVRSSPAVTRSRSASRLADKCAAEQLVR
jgi:hypothetical protein